MPSIACLKRVDSTSWDYHFVLVKPAQSHTTEDPAVAEAVDDLDQAFRRKCDGGSDAELAVELKARGYVAVDEFRIVRQ